jgi:hypothetical protein
VKISLSREELLNWAGDSVAFYQLDLSRLSSLLLAQIYDSEINRVYSTFDLTSPIKLLEGLITSDSTRHEEQFKHAPLIGLYKKHFTSPRFLVKNLQNFHRSKQGKRHFESAWDEACKLSGSGIVDETFIKYISHHATVDPIELKHRSREMTGEWVVFHKHNGANYYLTLAFHGETNAQIYQKVTLACEFDKLPFRV